MNNRKTIISIFGGSGIGKSTLAKALYAYDKSLFTRVPADYYLRAKETTSGRTLEYNWPLLKEHLGKDIGVRIEVPGFNYETWESAPSSGMSFTITPYIIVDSMRPYPDSDIFIRLEGDKETRRKRIIERDIRNKTNVIKDWDWHNSILENVLKLPADLVLDGTKNTDVLLENVLRFLKITPASQGPE